MPYNVDVTRSAATRSGSFNETKSMAATGVEGFNLAGSLAYAGTLSTRTDNDTGVVTTGVTHPLLTSDFADLYWDGGQRRRVDITAVTNTTISIDVGHGDNLPVVNTVVTIAKVIEKGIDLDGNDINGIFIQAYDAGTVVFYDNANTPIEIPTALFQFDETGSFIWIDEDADANPFLNTVITKVVISQQNVSQDGILFVGDIYYSS